MELRPADLQKEWKAKTFRPVYLFFGEDAAAKLEAVAQLKEAFSPDAFNLAEFSGDLEVQAAAAVSECLTIPIFSDKRLILVTAPKLLAGARAAFAEYLKEPMKSTTLVLFSEDKKPDFKDALAKAASAAGAVCVFSGLRDEEAASRLCAEARKAGKELAEDAAEALVEEAGTSWSVLRQELEKILLFARDAKEITREQALQCLGYQKAADPFALSRLIQARLLKESITQLRRLFESGKADDQAFRAMSQISSAVSKQFRAKRLQKAAVPADEIYRQLRLNKYWDKDYLSALSRFTEGRLRKDLKACLNTEVSLKSKTWLDPRHEVEQLVVELCRTKAVKP
ncbi:MAG: DNA polymerase III subunit delta [Elusimicrobiota bacterium]